MNPQFKVERGGVPDSATPSDAYVRGRGSYRGTWRGALTLGWVLVMLMLVLSLLSRAGEWMLGKVGL